MMVCYWPCSFPAGVIRTTVRWNRDVSLGCDVLSFAEQRKEDEQSKHGGLNEDGREQRAAANVAFTMALLRVAFDKTRL